MLRERDVFGIDVARSVVWTWNLWELKTAQKCEEIFKFLDGQFLFQSVFMPRKNIAEIFGTVVVKIRGALAHAP